MDVLKAYGQRCFFKLTMEASCKSDHYILYFLFPVLFEISTTIAWTIKLKCFPSHSSFLKDDGKEKKRAHWNISRASSPQLTCLVQSTYPNSKIIKLQLPQLPHPQNAKKSAVQIKPVFGGAFKTAWSLPVESACTLGVTNRCFPNGAVGSESKHPTLLHS